MFQVLSSLKLFYCDFCPVPHDFFGTSTEAFHLWQGASSSVGFAHILFALGHLIEPIFAVPPPGRSHPPCLLTSTPFLQAPNCASLAFFQVFTVLLRFCLMYRMSRWSVLLFWCKPSAMLLSTVLMSVNACARMPCLKRHACGNRGSLVLLCLLAVPNAPPYRTLRHTPFKMHQIVIASYRDGRASFLQLGLFGECNSRIRNIDDATALSMDN